METPTDEPTGPRGPRTTPPQGDPVKREPDPDSGEEATDEESDGPATPSRPHGDPMKKDLPRQSLRDRSFVRCKRGVPV
ncbi:MAG TPA: hypothetical protein VFZ69_05335 [Longimicrobiales bacterium]